MPDDKRFRTFIGFAVKAQKVLFGTDTIVAYKKKMRLILASEDMSENALKKLKSACRGNTVFAVLHGITVAELVFRENCKAIAVIDKNLADAAIGAMGEYATIL